MVESCVRGFHVYQDIWMPSTRERLPCKTEDMNPMDPYMVTIKKRMEVIGHVPHKISAACFLFIERGSTLNCIITDSRHQYSSDLAQGGLQIPCKLEFKCDDKALMLKIKKLVQSTPPIDFQCEQTVTKQKLQSLPKEKDERPAKKRLQILKDSPIINLDVPASQFTRDIAMEDTWVSFGRSILTTVDKDIILRGMTLAVLIHIIYECFLCRWAAN